MSYLFYYEDEDIFVHHSLDRNPDPEDFPLHTHEVMELYYFISGKGRQIVEGNSYDLEPHDILIFRNAEAHKMVLSPNEPYERVAIHFPATLFADIDPTGRLMQPFFNHPLGQLNRYRADDFLSHSWLYLLERLNHMHGTQEEKRLHVLSTLLPLLVELSDAFERLPNSPQTDARPMAAQLSSYINAHLYEELSLESLSNAFFISKSQINRIFCEATGLTVKKYISTKRLLAAKEKIQNGVPATRAAIECGFHDYSVFFRAYKKQFGSSPTQNNKTVLPER